jgi:hypothetical protein
MQHPIKRLTILYSIFFFLILNSFEMPMSTTPHSTASKGFQAQADAYGM